MNNKIIWISSYPKSGRNWLRILLESAILHKGESVNINTLNLSTIDKVRRREFDAYFGIPSSDLHYDELTYYYRKFLLKKGEDEERCFVATHHKNSLLKEDSLFPTAITRCAIQLVRNPLSIVNSLANHLKISSDRSIDLMNSPGISLVNNHLPSTTRVNLKIGNWSEHVHSWINNANYPVQIIRYEDLLTDPITTLKELLTFIEQKIDSTIIHKAVENASFDRLHVLEKQSGFREKPVASAVFFRKGKKDSWKEELTERQINKVMEHHGEMMAKMGYLT